jgi:hypothetical protein
MLHWRSSYLQRRPATKNQTNADKRKLKAGKKSEELDKNFPKEGKIGDKAGKRFAGANKNGPEPNKRFTLANKNCRGAKGEAQKSDSEIVAENQTWIAATQV